MSHLDSPSWDCGVTIFLNLITTKICEASPQKQPPVRTGASKNASSPSRQPFLRTGICFLVCHSVIPGLTGDLIADSRVRPTLLKEGGTFHSATEGTFESDMGGTFKLLIPFPLYS